MITTNFLGSEYLGNLPYILYCFCFSFCDSYQISYFAYFFNSAIEVPCSTTSAKVSVNVTTDACVGGECNGHGRCHNYLNGQVLFSTCKCSAGKELWEMYLSLSGGLFCLCKLDDSDGHLRSIGSIFVLMVFLSEIAVFCANNIDPGHILHSAAAYLALHCLWRCLSQNIKPHTRSFCPSCFCYLQKTRSPSHNFLMLKYFSKMYPSRFQTLSQY